MPYKFVADSIHTNKLHSTVAGFLHAKCNFRRKTAVLRFERPLRDLGATYDVHLRLTGKRVLDFILVTIELFFARVYR